MNLNLEGILAASLKEGKWKSQEDPSYDEILRLLKSTTAEECPGYPSKLTLGRMFLLGKVQYASGVANVKQEGWKNFSDHLTKKSTSGELYDGDIPLTIHMYALREVVDENKRKKANNQKDLAVVVKLCIVRILSQRAQKRRKSSKSGSRSPPAKKRKQDPTPLSPDTLLSPSSSPIMSPVGSPSPIGVPSPWSPSISLSMSPSMSPTPLSSPEIFSGPPSPYEEHSPSPSHPPPQLNFLFSPPPPAEIIGYHPLSEVHTELESASPPVSFDSLSPNEDFDVDFNSFDSMLKFFSSPTPPLWNPLN